MSRPANRQSAYVVERCFEPDPAKCARALLILLERRTQDETPTGAEFGRPARSESEGR